MISSSDDIQEQHRIPPNTLYCIEAIITKGQASPGSALLSALLRGYERQAARFHEQSKTEVAVHGGDNPLAQSFTRRAEYMFDHAAAIRLALEETRRISIMKDMANQPPSETHSHVTERQSALRWECVGHNPTRWSLGTLKERKMSAIKATVTRRKDGKWHWRTVERDFGVEPSRETALLAAERAMQI